MASGPVRAAALVRLIIVGFRLQVQLHEHRMHDAPLCRPVASCSAGASNPAGNTSSSLRRRVVRPANAEFDRGGHFAAMEVPDLLVGDVRAFFRPLR